MQHHSLQVCIACLVLVLTTTVAQAQPVSSPPAVLVNKHGGNIVIALNSTPVHLNPALHSGVLTGLVGTQLFAGLVRTDNTGNVLPYLATSWKYANHRRALTLHLRKNALFHDGTPITSADVAFSINTVRTYHPFMTMFSAVESIDTPDPHTVIIHLKHYSPALLYILTPVLTPILPRHIYGDRQDIRRHPANWKPVGSGPFRLMSYVPGERIQLARFENFFIPERPFLDTIEFKLFPGLDEIPMALQSGEVHLMGFSSLKKHHEQLRKQTHLTVTRQGMENIAPMAWLGFNLQSPPFDDVRVRKALALTIDREFIVTKIFRGGSVSMDGPLPPQSPFYTPLDEKLRVDIAEANRLLDEAGYTRDRSGKRMTIHVNYPPSDSALALPLIKYLRHRLSRTIGIDLSIQEKFDFTVWSQQVATGNFQAIFDIVFSWRDPVIGVHRTYHSTNIHRDVLWSNTLGYSNPQVDRILDDAGREPDPQKRRKLYADFQRIVRNDFPMIWIGTMPYNSIFDTRLRGLNESLWGLLAPMDNVYWAKEHP